jgi:hypothetical protein
MNWPTLPTQNTRQAHWKCIPVSKIQELLCILAGKPVAAPTHWLGASKPCRRLMSEGKLPCNGCQNGCRLRWTGYIPIFTRAGERFVIVTSEEAVRHLSDTLPGTGLKLHWLPERKKLSITIVASGPARFPPVDIRGFLLTLWGDKELSEVVLPPNNGVSACSQAS